MNPRGETFVPPQHNTLQFYSHRQCLMSHRQIDYQKAQPDMSRIKEREKSCVYGKREGGGCTTFAFGLRPEQVFLSWMFSVGLAWPYLNTSSQAEAQHKSARQGKFPLSWKHRLSWWHCPRCDRRFLYNDRWNEKQPILILYQSAIIYEPCSLFSISHPFPIVVTTPILSRGTCMSVSSSLKDTPMQALRSC